MVLPRRSGVTVLSLLGHLSFGGFLEIDEGYLVQI